MLVLFIKFRVSQLVTSAHLRFLALGATRLVDDVIMGVGLRNFIRLWAPTPRATF